MRLSHVSLLVRDLEVSKAFYLRFGFRLVVDQPAYCRFYARIEDWDEGDETLSLVASDAPSMPAARVGLEFPSPDALDAFVAALPTRGVTVAEGPVDRDWLWRDARVFDPDGHELMLFFAGRNKLDPPFRLPQ